MRIAFSPLPPTPCGETRNREIRRPMRPGFTLQLGRVREPRQRDREGSPRRNAYIPEA
jgi:hypothetical protein